MNKLTAQNFQETVNNAATPVIVDFYADWCMPCKMIAPLLQQVADQYQGKVQVYSVNIDENPTLAQTYQVMSIPNVVCFNKGKMHNRMIGAAPKEQIVKLFQDLL